MSILAHGDFRDGVIWDGTAFVDPTTLFTCTRSSVNDLVEWLDGTYTTVPANTIRKSDKGWLNEGPRTNYLRNNSMIGAVAGTPGTLPNNWLMLATGGGYTRQIVGMGTEGGLPYIDIRWSATTPTGSQELSFEARNNIVAAQSQPWSGSVFCRVVAGSLTNVTVTTRLITFAADGTTQVNANSVAMSALDAARRRFINDYAPSGAASAFVTNTIAIGASAAFDVTLRIYAPQCELRPSTSSTASSPILTTTVARLRQADRWASGATLNGYAVGAMRALRLDVNDCRVPGNAIRFGVFSSGDARFVSTGSGGGVGVSNDSDPTVTANLPSGTVANQQTRMAFGFDATGLEVRVNGSAKSTSAYVWQDNTGTFYFLNTSAGTSSAQGWCYGFSMGSVKGDFDAYTTKDLVVCAISQTMGGFTQDAVGYQEEWEAEVSQTMGAFTQDGYFKEVYRADIASTMEPFAQYISGRQALYAEIAQTMGAFAQAARAGFRLAELEIEVKTGTATASVQAGSAIATIAAGTANISIEGTT